ncbi:hypothetical protein GY45DRAFT_434020 [Cubamyces sp. BRFM 1775]|nr:hypothetical protein GY45DRAFT_434020 [Cubamyces sp. BRFM 1775]
MIRLSCTMFFWLLTIRDVYDAFLDSDFMACSFSSRRFVLAPDDSSLKVLMAYINDVILFMDDGYGLHFLFSTGRRFSIHLLHNRAYLTTSIYNICPPSISRTITYGHGLCGRLWSTNIAQIGSRFVLHDTVEYNIRNCQTTVRLGSDRRALCTLKQMN